MSYQEIVDRILSDAATSFNLRQRIQEDQKRDPVDAMNDAEMLHEVASIRLYETMNRHRPTPPSAPSSFAVAN
jgi:hypothetical protein